MVNEPTGNNKAMPQKYLVVALTTVRYSKLMLYIREGWVREMLVYTKPYNKAVYTMLKLHPNFNDVAPLEVQEWMRYNTTADENAARDVYLRHQRGKVGY